MVELIGDVCIPSELHVGALPTSDPQVVGMVWSDSGVLTVSAG